MSRWRREGGGTRKEKRASMRGYGRVKDIMFGSEGEERRIHGKEDGWTVWELRGVFVPSNRRGECSPFILLVQQREVF